MHDIYQKIINAQRNSDAMIDIINQFTPLIKKYSVLLFLDLEDAIAELTTEFIRIIAEFPGKQEYGSDMFVLSYIKKSVRNAYIAISKKQAMHKVIYVNDFVCCEPSYEPEYNLWLEDLLSILTESQKKVIILKYIYDYSDIEIAEMLHISRQAINQIKNRAFHKLRCFIKLDIAKGETPNATGIY